MFILEADAAKIMATELSIPITDEREKLYGLWPAFWPGGYEGVLDGTYPDRPTTYEVLIVALVRWNGWDTVGYDRGLVSEIAKYASPNGVPYYRFSPSPRSIPYIAAAIQNDLIVIGDVTKLQLQLDRAEVRALSIKALSLHDVRANIYAKPTKKFAHLSYPTDQARLAVLQPGFNDYKNLTELPGRILDLSGPEIRLFNAGSQLAHGQQMHFPLGSLDTMLGVGLHVDEDHLAHQSQAIFGMVDNRSSTVNAVGVWGQAKSWTKDARVWGGFFVAETDGHPEGDAQVVGLEVDVINNAGPGHEPHASKSGIQIVGLGDYSLSDAINVIGAGKAKWHNGLIFAPDAIEKEGSYIAMSSSGPVARGIDMAGVRFTDAAIALGGCSAITFKGESGAPAAIYTDEHSRLIVRTSSRGFLLIDNDGNSILEVDNGRISGWLGENLLRLAARVDHLESLLTEELQK